MTEAEWLFGTDYNGMIGFLFVYNGGKATKRKGQLFGCACARRVWELLDDSRTRRLVEVTELFADGLASEAELGAAIVGARAAIHAAIEASGMNSFEHLAACCPLEVGNAPFEVAAQAVDLSGDISTESDWMEREESAQIALMYDLFGNPFRLVSVDPHWLLGREGLLRRLAEAVYQERDLPAGTLDPDRLAVLADALEESGYNEPAILGHLRSAAPHYRGCHVLDALLARS
jgi:hypothetical protein